MNHNLLILKLKSYGFCNPRISWFIAFFSNIIQNVKYESFNSNNIYTTSGVPQGCNLSPLLFLFYINDISNIIKYFEFLLLAEDLKLKLFKQNRFCENASPSSKGCKLFSSIGYIDNDTIHYGNAINILNITRVNEVNDLGIKFDQNFRSMPILMLSPIKR